MRIHYDDNWGDDPLEAGRWLARVRSQALSRRGALAFRALEAALLAQPRHRLIRGALADRRGDFCALGSLASHKGAAKVWLQGHAYQDDEEIMDWAEARLDVPKWVAWMIMDENDERASKAPEVRWDDLLSFARRWIRNPTEVYREWKAARLA